MRQSSHNADTHLFRYCLNLPFGELYNLNQLIASSTFSTQQQFADFLAGRKAITGA